MCNEWREIETAPRDGTLLILWVEAINKENSCHPTEDAMAWRTIGHNNFDHDERDVWQFAGWCWQHDRWVEGDGVPVLWMSMPGRSDAHGAGLRRADPPVILAEQPAPPLHEDRPSTGLINDIIRDVSELPDRTSPADQPDMMLVSADELRALLMFHISDNVPPALIAEDGAKS